MSIRTAKFKLGDVDRTVNVPISLALHIEDATGIGMLDLMRAVLNQSAKLGTVVTIIRVAFNESRQMLSDADILAHIERDGFYAGYVAAASILNAFFKVPEADDTGRASKKVKALDPTSP